MGYTATTEREPMPDRPDHVDELREVVAAGPASFLVQSAMGYMWRDNIARVHAALRQLSGDDLLRVADVARQLGACADEMYRERLT